MFDAVSGAKRVQVKYEDETIASCHSVTDLDRPAGSVQHDIAAFVELCARIRVHYQLGETVRTMFDRVSAAEGTSSPERQGRYDIPPLSARVAERPLDELAQQLAVNHH